MSGQARGRPRTPREQVSQCDAGITFPFGDPSNFAQDSRQIPLARGSVLRATQPEITGLMGTKGADLGRSRPPPPLIS